MGEPAPGSPPESDPKPKRHESVPTLWVNVRSAIQWLVGGSFFFVGCTILIAGSLVVSPFTLEPLLHRIVSGLVFLLGVKIRAHGLEKLDPQKAYLFIFNHINRFDHFFVYYILKRRLRGVEKEAHFRWPIYGTMIKRMGQVPIPPRGDTQRAIIALARLRKLFEQGVSIAVLPEGTRSATGELQKFKKGAFYLAIESGATIVPIVLVGAYEFMKKGDWRFYPRPIDIYIEDPIPTASLMDQDVTRLRDQVREVIGGRIEVSRDNA